MRSGNPQNQQEEHAPHPFCPQFPAPGPPQIDAQLVQRVHSVLAHPEEDLPRSEQNNSPESAPAAKLIDLRVATPNLVPDSQNCIRVCARERK